MKIYVVWVGEYDDRRIVLATTDEQLANETLEKLKKAGDARIYLYENGEIEVYEDGKLREAIPKCAWKVVKKDDEDFLRCKMSFFDSNYDKFGEVRRCKQTICDKWGELVRVEFSYRMFVECETEVQAREIFKEKLAEYKEKQEEEQ